MHLLEIREGIYTYLGDYDPHNGSNFGVITSSEGVVVIDCKVTREQEFLQEIKAITDRPIRFLINTHSHPDHVSSNDLFAREGAVIIATQGTRRRLDNWGEADFLSRLQGFAYEVKDISKKSLILPVLTFDGEITLHLGQREVRLVDMGTNHSYSDLVAYLPQDGVLFSGDLLFSQNHCVLKAHSFPNPLHWVQTLDRLLEWPWETVVPGHGPVSTKVEMRTFRDYLVYLQESIHALVDAGKSLEEVKREVDLSAYSSWGHRGSIPETLEALYRVYRKWW